MAPSIKSRRRLATGVSGLDEVLNGGLPAGHLYLIEGDPGTGKTTIALKFLLTGVRENESVLYVTLSESKSELLMVGETHGWNMKGLPIFEMTPVEEELSPEAQYTVFHPSEVELGDTIASILKEVDRLKPTRVVFDSLSELRMLARDPLRYRRQVLGLKRYFSDRDCTVVLLDDRTSDSKDLQLQSIAHGVIMLQSLDRDFGVKRRRLEVRKLRGSRFREGFHDFTIETGGLEVSPRLVAAEHKPGFKRQPISSGLPELDKLLGGGIDTGTSTLLLGPSGAGKSTVALRYVYAALERGECVSMFAFDEAVPTMLFRLNSLGLHLQPYIDSGKFIVHQVDPAELSPGDFVSRVRVDVEEHKATIVLIDSMNGLLTSMPDEKFLSLQLHELFSYLGQQGVVTLVTLAQHGFFGTGMQTPIDISYLADTVILCRYFESGGVIKQAISVLKKRSGMHERAIRELILANGQIRIGQQLRDFEGVLTGTPSFVGTVQTLNESERESR